MICTNVFRLFTFALLAFSLACSPASHDDQGDWSKLDLMPYGIPVEIMAPDSARVNVTRVGQVEDVAIRNEGTQPFSIQIFVQPVLLNDLPALKFNQINEVRSNPEFGKIVEEDEQGFIFFLNDMDGGERYHFRYVHLQADREYVFTSGFEERFSLEEARRMLNSVRQQVGK
ncbi:MAG: hypothetical protein ACKOA4_01300 [Haliscomenobacter sp.]